MTTKKFVNITINGMLILLGQMIGYYFATVNVPLHAVVLIGLMAIVGALFIRYLISAL